MKHYSLTYLLKSERRIRGRKTKKMSSLVPGKSDRTTNGERLTVKANLGLFMNKRQIITRRLKKTKSSR